MISLKPLSDSPIPLSLTFPGELEKDFLDSYAQRSLKHVRLALVSAILFYGIFGILDAWIVPDVKHKLWFIRYVIYIPFVFSVFLFSFSKYFLRYMQPCSAAVILVAGLGIIAMTVIASSPGNHLYYAGLLLAFIFGYAFMKLRFFWASLTGWTIVVAYEFAAIWLSDTPTPILVNNNFFFLSGNIIGMFACYSIEFYSRKDFIQARQLEDEKKKVEIAKHGLEKRVKDRTEQLVNLNEDLKQEIAERNLVQEALRKSEEKYRTIIEGIEEGYFELDLGGNMIFFNDSMCEILGYPRDELIGRSYRLYTNVKNARKMHRVFNRIYQSGEPTKIVDFLVVRKDGGTRVVEISASLTRNLRGRPIGFRGVARDVTEHKRAEEELKKSKEAAEKANLAKTEFLANMSHELRTPLNHIIGFTELVVDKQLGDLNDTQHEYLNDVLKSSKHLLSLINDVLDLSKVEAGRQDLETSDVTVRELLADSLAMVKEKARQHGIELSLDLDGIPDVIKADERKLKQVFYNLISNAVKFTPEGGCVSLKARMANQRFQPDLHRGDPEGLEFIADHHHPDTKSEGQPDGIEFCVSDTGIGLRREDTERIFNRFEQVENSASRNYGGAGLGLSLAKSLVELHHGAIWAESDGPGKGSRFHFVIPT
jgi:PAS domain S-box-containing protein